jgi:tetratricopeptide (TPR) repeat protein
MNFDVFLSHKTQDKPAVEEIAKKLQEKYNLKCWFDKWNLIPGTPWEEGIEEGLNQSRTVAIFVGPSGIGPWENEEMQVALAARVRDHSRRVIPILLPGAPDSKFLKLPTFLSSLTWVDIRAESSDERAIHLLYCGIKGIAPGASPEEEKSLTLPAGFNIPFPQNKLFTGREKDLETLAEALLGKRPSATLISQAVTGMGGIGKTQLAVEFAYRYGYQFAGVHWLNLANPESLDAEIANCGRSMGLTYDDQREQVANTMKLWQSGGLRLLILDNFEALDKSSEALARLQGAQMRILITSRRDDWPRELGLQRLPLKSFSEKESLEFLERSLAKKESEADRKALADTFGHLPLALELAAKYINVNQISIKKYLQELKEILADESMNKEWFRELEIKSPTQHELSLLGTFHLSWILVKDEIEQNVFRIAGYCAPNTPIPLEIFIQTLELDDKQIHKTLYRLNALGLLNAAEVTPTIHPLLAAFARSVNQGIGLLEKLAGKLAGLADQANDQVDQTGSLGWFVPLRSHIVSVGDYAERAGVKDSASLFVNLGYYLEKIADYTGAKTYDERALKIDEASFGPDHPNVAIDVNNLGSVLKALGDLAGAKTYLERALKIDEASFGPDHPKVAIRVNNLGSVLQELGDLKGAKTYDERALKIDEASFGPDHPNVAIRVNNLGSVLQDLGDLAGAKTYYERALKIWENNLGANHPNVATCVNNLGLVLKDLGDLAGAKTYYERALKIDEANFGADHPNVARDVNNLGSVLQDLGDLAGAKTYLERALKIDEASFGPDHPNVARDVNNLGSVLQDLGDLAGAKTYLERALKIREKSFGKEHPDVASSLWWLGVVAQNQGNKILAKDYYEQALTIYQKFLPSNHATIKEVKGFLQALEEKE